MCSKNKKNNNQNTNVQIAQQPGQSEFSLIFDRLNAIPCNECRKRSACVIRPIKDRCRGLEKGDVYVSPNDFFED